MVSITTPQILHIIYVTGLTRITRSTQDLFELIDNIQSKKVRLKSLKDTYGSIYQKIIHTANS
ncbi:hypothetical protein J32TS6_04010 [Virgibacillus pantothenticus]|nr:hypothetical protein J32TS6_04010 [Virgibacillus pantothenticus]